MKESRPDVIADLCGSGMPSATQDIDEPPAIGIGLRTKYIHDQAHAVRIGIDHIRFANERGVILRPDT